jgi:DNA replication protein DnaC
METGFPKRHVKSLEKMHGPALHRAQELRETVESRDCLLVLCGKRGPGKTQIATFWAQSFKFPAYFKAHDLIHAIRGEFSQDLKDRKDAKSAIKRAKLRDYLVIDEFSELAGSDYEKRSIVNIIDHRYDQMKATVIVTNTEEKDLAKSLGASIVSRCRESGGVIVCDWPSYR